MVSYEEMLDSAFGQLPKEVISTVRYEIPKVMGHIEGNKTIITNFIQICNILNRKVDHLLKYLQRELATPAKMDGSRLVLGRKISSNSINSKISEYADNFVLCYNCKKPDTTLIKEGEFMFIKCMACGAKNRVKRAL
ncbi:MAG: translation initiation factor IF-2 subunit beta [Nanoarchaeota archaeon]